MSLTVSDPSTYTVPEGQALLFTAVENSETVYKYKLSSGSIGTTTLSVVKALDVKPADLPCLVYSADLLNCMNENFVSVGEMAIAIATKASVKYVKQIADQKVSKATFLSTVAEMPTTAEMSQALALKADASTVATDLSGKANASDVYTQAETVALLESFIGAHTVADITALNALEPGIYRFVWVLDPSDDDTVVDQDSPALYRWRKAHDDSPAGYEFLQSATSGAFSGSVQEILDILGSGFDSNNTVAAAIASKQNAITGTAGQYVRINAQGVPEAVSVSVESLSEEFDLHDIVRKFMVDESSVVLDPLADASGLCNLAGGFGLEVISYRRLDDSNDAAGAIIQVAPIGEVVNQYGRYVDLYNASKSQISDLSAANQAKGLYGVTTSGSDNASYGTPSFIRCTKDLVTMIEAVRSKGNVTNNKLSLYYIDPVHAATPTGGTLYKSIPYSTINGYGSTLYWKMELGSTVQPSGVDYLTTDKLSSVGLGSFSSSGEEAFFDVYLSDKETVAISGDSFEENSYYLSGSNTPIESAAEITIPDLTNPDNPVYRNVLDENGDVVIAAAAISAGLYKKDVNGFIRIRPYMVPEKFEASLFTDSGKMYIHPGKTNFSGVANQVYEFGKTVGTDISFLMGTAAGSDPAPIEAVIIKLKTAITNGETTSVFTPTAGSIADPILAVLKSDKRYSTSTVSGEYNAAVGLNSEAGGNQNTVFGDWSKADGLCNVISGDMSFAQGTFNVVTGAKSNAYGDGNIVAGSQNITVGSANLAHGYYSVLVGDGNQTFGIHDIAIGLKNAVFTSQGFGAIAIGSQNIVQEKAKESVVIGKELNVHAEYATVVGQKGELPKFEGKFPGEDTDVLKDISAASVDAWTNLGYDESWISNKEGLFFGSGIKENRVLTSIFPLAFTRYRVRPNIAGYFSLATGDGRNSAVDPYLFEPYMQWTFTGAIQMVFADPQPDNSDPDEVTKYTFSKRNGGRVKSFDPGIEFNTDSVTDSSMYLDFDKATRWKIKTTGTGIVALTPMHFVDGAEAYIVAYAGVNISWTKFTSVADPIIGQNVFDELVWPNNSAIVTANKTSGFALLKLHVVDNICIIEVIHNSLA